MSRPLLLAALAALAVAGCAREKPAPDTPDETVNQPAPVAPSPPPAEKPKPPPADAKVTVAPADDEPVDAGAQTQEDADAVGMTTRAPPPLDDPDGTPTTNVSVATDAQ